MKEDDTYYMLATRGDGLYKEKGSKFIAEAFTVMSEDEAKTAIATIFFIHCDIYQFLKINIWSIFRCHYYPILRIQIYIFRFGICF